MATKSILKNIVISDPEACAALVDAIESSAKKDVKELDFAKNVRTANEDEIEKLFGEKKSL